MAPTPPPSAYSPPPRRRPARIGVGVVGALVILGIKLFALAGVSHLLHGSSPVVIFIVLIAVAVVVRRLTRFIGR